MKAKITCILVMTLLITTALPVIGQTYSDEYEILNNSGLGNNNREILTIEEPFFGENRGVLFMQLPKSPKVEFNGLFSDLDRGIREFDDFWDITYPICDAHWWGFGVDWNGTHWVDCPPIDMVFDVTFYYDDGTGKPGDEACVYNDISPTITPTGLYYEIFGSTGILELYYFEVELIPCCEISDGWFSVIKTYNPSNCTFAWMTCPDANWNMWRYNIFEGEWIWLDWDLSFILTDGTPKIPDLDCRGEFKETGVKTGTRVYGFFEIANIGDTDSVLQWRIESWPDWGSHWTFSDKVGFLTTDTDWKRINVSVIAPDVPNKQFTGKITVVNAIDPSEYCEIPVTVTTPKNKAIQNPILQFLQSHPNLFPLLQKLIQSFGL